MSLLSPLKSITKVSEFMEILEWDFDEHGLTINDWQELSATVAARFPELVNDMDFPDEEED